MKKKTKNLVLLLMIFLILCSVLLLTRYLSEKKARQQEEESASESIANIVYLISAEDIKGFSYENNGTEFSFSYDGQWYYEPDRNFPVNQTRLNDFKTVFLDLTIEKTIEAKDDLSAYGLDNPAYSVEITGTQDEKCTLKIGDMASNGDYYAQLDGKQEIYTISDRIVAYLSDELMEFVASITVPSLSVDNVKKLTMTAENKTLQLERNGDEWSFSITSDNANQSGSVTNVTAITDLLETMNGFTGDNCVDYYCEEAEKENYGLAAPSITVNVVYTDESGTDVSYDLYVGSAATESTWYYMNSDSDMTGTIAQTRVEALQEAFTFTYAE